MLREETPESAADRLLRAEAATEISGVIQDSVLGPKPWAQHLRPGLCTK